MADIEKTIKALKDWKNDPLAMNAEIDPCLVDDALSVIEQMGQERRWIPVSERLPDDGSDILVYCDDGEESRIVACNYDNGVWFDCIFCQVTVFKHITHWMPLPQPPTNAE